MIDSLPIKPFVKTNVTGSVLGTASTFERIVASAKNEFHRRHDLTIDSTGDNTRVLRIAHQPASTRQPIQRSLIGTMDTLKRYSGDGILMATDSTAINTQISFGSGVTPADFERAMMLHLGALFACYEAVYRLES